MRFFVSANLICPRRRFSPLSLTPKIASHCVDGNYRVSELIVVLTEVVSSSMLSALN